MLFKIFKKNKLLTILLITTLIAVWGVFYLKNAFLNYKIISMGATLKRFLVEENIQIKNYPSKLQLLLDQIKILYKLDLNNKNSKDLNHKENIAGFQVVFTDFLSLQIVFNEIFIHKEYFFFTDSKEPFVIDCGSNIGMATLFFKKLYPNSKILAFEPSQKNFELLEQNIKNNNLTNVTAIKKAVYSKKTNIDFFFPGSTIGTIHGKNSSYNTEIVETTILSEYINQKVDLLKIDIEGSESLVMEDLANNNKFQYIKEMIIEYHPAMKKNKLSKIFKILEDNKYKYQISSPLKTPFKRNLNMAFLIHAYK